jgi:hypothetical protein
MISVGGGSFMFKSAREEGEKKEIGGDSDLKSLISSPSSRTLT